MWLTPTQHPANANNDIAQDAGTNPGTGLTPDFLFVAEGGPHPTSYRVPIPVYVRYVR